VAVNESAQTVAERLVALFNRDFGAGEGPLGTDTRALWVDEPVIVPLRAQLEGSVYEGPTALDDFVAASHESWSSLRLQPDEFRQLDPERVLMTGNLVGAARGTGLQTQAPVAMLFVVRGGRVAEAHTFASESEALLAASR
jgi:hypothetical protein